MNDKELKSLLLQTCPVLPGQEARAWNHLRSRLAPSRTSAPWFLRPAFTYALMAVVVVPAIFFLGLRMQPVRHGLAFADSQVPGIYATSFYSHTAQAQVVWLNGMDPATDKPTYLDPTAVIHDAAETATGIRVPDSL
jgi:hypothetical protein